ncbi:hypothetical protein ACFX13_039597 [Malus domestica]
MVGYGDPNDQHYRNVDVGDGDDVLGKNSSDGKITVEVKLPEIITLGELQPGEIRCTFKASYITPVIPAAPYPYRNILICRKCEIDLEPESLRCEAGR